MLLCEKRGAGRGKNVFSIVSDIGVPQLQNPQLPGQVLITWAVWPAITTGSWSQLLYYTG